MTLYYSQHLILTSKMMKNSRNAVTKVSYLDLTFERNCMFLQSVVVHNLDPSTWEVEVDGSL